MANGNQFFFLFFFIGCYVTVESLRSQGFPDLRDVKNGGQFVHFDLTPSSSNAASVIDAAANKPVIGRE